MDGLLINLKFYTLKSKTIQLFYRTDKFLLWNLSVFKSIGRQIEMEKPSREAFEGNNKLLIGIVLSVITFWLFAQSLVNVVPILEDSFNTDIGTVNIAVSITALFSGMFVVGAGGLADKYGRIKLTNIGIILNILGSLLIIISNIPLLLILGRLIQGLSAACIMPATLSIIKSYYIGKDRQRALSYWSIGSWGGSGVCSFFGGAVATLLGWRWIFILSIIISLKAHLKLNLNRFL